MEAYTGFAEVYDTFMDNVPYEEWGAYLCGLLEEYGIRDGIVADLGCGTGTMTEYLAEKGYDMIGIDASEEMLEIAQEKKEKSGYEILYLLQDMREFELYGTVRAIISVCDSINYITEPGDLRQVFHWADNYLDPDGVFIFDFNTEYKYREVLGDQTIAENRETCSFIWDNYYYEEERINEYELSLFIRENKVGTDMRCTAGIRKPTISGHIHWKRCRNFWKQRGCVFWRHTMHLRKKDRLIRAKGFM